MMTDSENIPQDAIRFVGEMQRLALQPGDVIAITSNVKLTEAEIAHLKRQLESTFTAHRCIILDEGLSIGVIGDARA